MITGSVSLSPVVVTTQLAENQLKQQVAKQALSDKINIEAKEIAKTVSTLKKTEKKEVENQPKEYKSFDRRM
jgi:mannose/fructose/N-acetylgalactosamine-specific phosphotransferase system component IIB